MGLTAVTMWQKLRVLQIFHGMMLAEWYPGVWESLGPINNALFLLTLCFGKSVLGLCSLLRVCTIMRFHNALVPYFCLIVAKALCSKVSLIARKSKWKLSHFTKNDVGKVKMLGRNFPERSSRFFILCKRKPFLYIHSCAEYNLDIATFSISHTTDTNFLCRVPHHQGAAVDRYKCVGVGEDAKKRGRIWDMSETEELGRVSQELRWEGPCKNIEKTKFWERCNRLVLE